MLNDPKGLTLKTSKDATGKYGRILGEIWRTSNYSNQSINQFMIDKHHAVAYFGQSKQDIAEQHLLNRQHVQTELSEFKLTED